jgi:hypothetical protein
MNLSNEPRYTSEVYARRFLDFGPDTTLVTWAENMVLAGFISDGLYILLGEIEPFNKFEIDSLLDRIQREIHLPKIRSAADAIEIVATACVRRYLSGNVGSESTLFILAQLCISEGYEDAIYDFYLLHYAAVDLETSDIQYYWPDAHSGNIEKLIRTRYVSWIEDHPLPAWQAYEFKKD